jgi:predicted ATPase
MTKDVLESGPRSGNGQSRAAMIPASLQDSLMSRLDRLGSAKRLAQIGAALGREFPRDMLQTVAEMPSQVFDVALRQLQLAGLMFERGVQEKQTCVFKHALVQEAAYGSMLKRRRQELHVHIAEVLSEHRADLMTSQPEVLARHWSEGGRANEAHPCWLAAGKMATQRFALEEARTFFTRGLEAVSLLDAGETRDTVELEFRVALGTVLRMTVGPGAAETQANYDAAMVLCDRLPESPDQFAALWGKWINAMSFKLELGLEWTQRLLQLATKLDDAGFQLQAHHATWTTLFHIGRFADAYDHTRQGLAYYDEKAHRHHAAQYGGHDPRICGGGFAAHALWMLDRHDESLAFARRCIDWGEALGETGSLLHVIEIHLLLYLFRNEPEQSVPWMNRLSEICDENDLPEYAGKLRFNSGWLHASRGEVETGIRMMLEGRANQVKIGSLEDIPLFSEKLARFLSGVERIDEGLQLLDESLEIADANSLCYWLAEVHRRRGILLDEKGESVAARESLRTALDVAIEQQAITLQRRAAQSLIAHSEYHEQGVTPDVVRAKQLLEELDVG